MSITRAVTTRYLRLATILAILPGLLVLSHARVYASTGWEVSYDGSDLTGPAMPIPVGTSVLLNIAGVGPMLGATVMPDSSGFTIQAADGVRWHWETGAASLTSDSRMISLAVPGIQEGVALYLDPQAISELCRIPVTIDASAKQVSFRRTQVAAPMEVQQAPLTDGWQAFTIAKPKAARQALSFLSPKTISENLPSTHDRLNIGLGLGYVQGADYGLELTSSGRVGGGDLSLSLLTSSGELGTRVRSSHLLWLDKIGGTGVEAGDMYSETWGLVQGIRYMRKAGNHWPTFSLNINTERTLNPEASISYLDEFKLLPGFTVRGEVGTDRSGYANVRLDGRPLQVFAFTRSLSHNLGNSQGIYGSLSLSKSISVFYGMTRSTDEFDRTTTYRNTGIRIPLMKRWGLVLGQTQYDGKTTSSKTQSAGLTVPLPGGVHLYLRYQKNSLDMEGFSGQLIDLHNDTDTLLTSLSLFASPKIHLDYQRNMLMQEGRTAYYEQMITNYTISPRATLQVISGFPNIVDPDIFRVRLDQRLSEDTSLVLDYGRLSPYQSRNDFFGKRGFMVMLRKTWPLSVPAKGGSISGVVTDHSGHPLPNIGVRMGTYTAVSDANGRYSFACTPTGKYHIGIPEESVPADYRVETNSQEIKVERDSKHTVDFKLVPYGCILGRVWMDGNGNNSYDPGEGVRDIPVAANNHVTATDKDGRFGFFNLEPGNYLVRIPIEYLDRKYAVHGSMMSNVDLQPKSSVTDMEFRIEFKKKPIIYATVD